MAQTKKRRRSKHRGTATGRVETRGRTGRKPTSEENKAQRKATARERRMDRFDRPPTWRSAANRAVIAVVIFFAAVVLLFKQSAIQAAALSAFMLVLYIPMGYYTDQWMYRRRQRQKAEGKARG